MYFSRVQLQPDLHHSSQLGHVLMTNPYGLHQLLWDLFPAEKERTFLFREEIVKEQLKNQRCVKGGPLFFLVSKHEPVNETPIFMVESKKYVPIINKDQHFNFKLRANPVIARKALGKKHSTRHDVFMDAQRNLLGELACYLGLSDYENLKKSILRHRVFCAWRKSENRPCTEKLREVIRTNKRFESLLENNLTPVQQFEWALKAASDFALESWLRDKGTRNGFELVDEESMNGRVRLQFQAEGYRWHAMPRKGRNAGFSSVDFDGSLRVVNPSLFKDMLFNGIGPAKAFGCGLMMVRRAC